MLRKNLLLLFLLVSWGIAAGVEAQTRIRFRRGAFSASAGGNLHGYNEKRRFVIRVRSGQVLTTERVGNRHITVFVRDPAGQIVGDSDASCNDRREISPTRAGDYLIEVVECRKADPWRGRFSFRVTVR